MVWQCLGALFSHGPMKSAAVHRAEVTNACANRSDAYVDFVH